ncbi:MAG: tetraacyldisaccharide 4'-kinase [Gammaproteobacteria bacterium]
MNSRRFQNWLLQRWYGTRPVPWLIPFTGLFVLLAALRRAAYRLGLLRRIKLPVPVIVVGNIAVGGTGKTPFVIWLAGALQARGYSPGIVTRGYGGAVQHWPLRVSAASDPAMVGDEAVLLARRTGLPVAASPDRVAAARLLLHAAGVDLIVSDDGLQHYRLGRDLEIIMLDGARGLGNGWCLPAGPLREPAARLAHIELLVAKQGPVTARSLPSTALAMQLAPEGVVNLASGARVPLGKFAGQRVHAVAGIGNPQQFFAMLRTHGLQLVEHAWPDHARFVPADFAFAEHLPVLMTEKDAIKCGQFKQTNLWYVVASAEFSAADTRTILERVSVCMPAAGSAAGTGKPG